MSAKESSAVSLDTCLGVAKYLASLVEDSYMYPKASALILNSAGDVYFTRSGVNVIKEAYCCHPIAKIIIDALEKHHKITGDGSKLYILMLHAMLLAIKNRYKCVTLRTEHRIQILEEISQLMYIILPPIFGNLRQSYPSVQYFIDIDNADDIVKSIKSIVKTFFQYKFTKPVSMHLSSLIIDFICRSITNWKDLPFLIDYAVSNFSVLCSKCVASVQDSCVLEGIILRETASKSVNHAINKSFIIINDVFKNECNTTILMQNDSSVKQSVEMNYRFYKYVTRILIEKDISVLISQDSIPEELASLCIEKDIMFLGRICEEEVERVIWSTGVIPLHDVCGGIKPENIGHFNFIKALVFGQHRHIHVGLPEKHNRIFPHHIMLAAPFESLYKECYRECINSFKVVQQWMLHVQQCHNNLFCRGTENDTSVTKPDFFVWNISHIDTFTHNCFKPVPISSSLKEESTLVHKMIGIAYPVGLWEVWVLKALSLNNRSYPSVKDSVLLHALTEVIKKRQHTRAFLSNHSQQSCMDMLERNQEIKLSINDADLEPIASKEMLIYSVLNVVMQLIRLDTVVSVKHLCHVHA